MASESVAGMDEVGSQIPTPVGGQDGGIAAHKFTWILADQLRNLG
jgi:hypothetical protein